MLGWVGARLDTFVKADSAKPIAQRQDAHKHKVVGPCGLHAPPPPPDVAFLPTVLTKCKQSDRRNNVPRPVTDDDVVRGVMMSATH